MKNDHALGRPLSRLAGVAALTVLSACGGGGLSGWEGTPATGCQPATTHADRDVRRAAPRLAPPICVESVRVQGSTGAWQLTILSEPGRAGPLWLVPHDDEDAGFDGALAGLRAYGGTLVAVEAAEQRLSRGRDPNRAFGAGRCAVGKGRGDAAYTRAVLARVGSAGPVIAVHSNAGRTVSMRRPYPGAAAFRASAPVMPLPGEVAPVRRDDATMVILAGPRPPAADHAAMARIRWFTDRGVNVMYETVTPAGNDCSLSNHAVLTGVGPTYTIEVRDGDSATARTLVELVAEHAGLGG